MLKIVYPVPTVGRALTVLVRTCVSAQPDGLDDCVSQVGMSFYIIDIS